MQNQNPPSSKNSQYVKAPVLGPGQEDAAQLQRVQHVQPVQPPKMEKQTQPLTQQLTPQQIEAIQAAYQAKAANPNAPLTPEQVEAIQAAQQLKARQAARPAAQTQVQQPPVPQEPIAPQQEPPQTDAQKSIEERAHAQVIPEVQTQPRKEPVSEASSLEQMFRDKAEQEKLAQEQEEPDEATGEESEEESLEEEQPKKKLLSFLSRRKSKKDNQSESDEEDEAEQDEEPLDEESSAETQSVPVHPEPTVGQEIRSLALKIVYVLAAFFIVFTFIFGLHRNLSAGMQPSLRDGDLLFYYRLDHDFRANNVVVFEYQDELIASRVIAVEGDTVNITDRGLEINGHVIYEPEIYSPTTQFKNGPTFPLTVEHDTVFCLGDNREHANDSRIVGLIEKKDIKGKVMGVIRRRNL